MREGGEPIQFEKETLDDLFDVDRYLAKLSARLMVIESARKTVGPQLNKLRPGDIITDLDGSKLRSLAEWNERMAKSQTETVKIQIIRDQKPLKFHGDIGQFRNHTVKEVYAAPVFK